MKHLVSSGGAICRRDRGTLEFALILRLTLKGAKIWCLPKGLMESGESPEETACREVREETGLEGRPMGDLGPIQYVFYSPHERSKVRKTVHFFLMKFLRGDVRDHDDEVEEARWFPAEQAIQNLAYESERGILNKAIQWAQKPEKGTS